MRSLSLLLTLSILALGCAAATTSSPTPPPSPSPTPALGSTVTTPAEAWAAVVAAEPRFANVMPLDPDLIGASAWYEIQPASGVGAFVVRVTIGWGDCQAGCIDRHVWTLAVAPDGTVTTLSEEGPDVPADAIPD